MVDLATTGLTALAADGTRLTEPISLTLHGGSLVSLIGPNGAGKSSLMRSLAGIGGYSGTAHLDGEEIGAMRPRARARRISWLPQSLPAAWPVTVRAAVALGRYPHGADPSVMRGADADAVERALLACDVAALADRRITTLSGGELARVHLARALATQADVLLADEPAASLDLAHRWAVMNILREEARQGRLVLAIVHDIELAARWADRMIVLDRGQLVADGSPGDVVSPTMLADVFGVEARLIGQEAYPAFRVTGPVAAAAGSHRPAK